MAEPIDKDTRGPVNLRIKFRSESLQQFIERYGVDVSRGGIFIRTREPLPVGTRLKLDFQLVDTAPLFQGDGTVVWIREHDASRAGVTPGMGVRFDRLTPESQTTLDTILEEKIRLQQSGVAPGSIAKAGAGMAVRRPSGAFATIEPIGKPAGPPPLPIQMKPEMPHAPHAPPPPPPIGAAPVNPMPASATRSGPLAASTAASSSSNSIFNRPRTTSGLRTVPAPSALFEPPTADDIDKALSALEEKGGPAPSLPIAPVVIPRTESRSIGDDEPTKVFDGSVEKEFAAHDAITGPASVVPEDGIPIDAAGGEGDLTERRSVDPNSGKVTLEGGGVDGKAPPPPPASLDAPLASLVDSGAAPPAKPPAPPLSKPSATGPASAAVPIKIATDRPAATESGRFRSDTRYKRKRGRALPIALGVLVVGGGIAAGGYYLKLQRDKRAADAITAAAASPPIAAGQQNPAPAPAGQQQAAPAPETPPGPSGVTPTPAAPTGEATAKTAAPPAPKPEEAAAKPIAKVEDKTEKSKTEKGGDKAAAATEKSSERSSRRKKDRSASGAAETAAPVAAKPPETEKKPAEEAKPAGEAAKTDAPKAEAAKPAEGDKPEKPAEAAAEKKPAEAAPSAPPSLKITSSPAGAEVVIDGVPVGTTPFSSKEIDPAGTHAISVKKDGFESHERMISGSDWSRGKGGAQSLKFNVKLKKVGGEAKPAPADTGEKKPPDVEILTPSEP
jgi:uncharacterized protein (TIGR02266 family)